jgi:hypothetical protein
VVSVLPEVLDNGSGLVGWVQDRLDRLDRLDLVGWAPLDPDLPGSHGNRMDQHPPDPGLVLSLIGQLHLGSLGLIRMDNRSHGEVPRGNSAPMAPINSAYAIVMRPTTITMPCILNVFIDACKCMG